MRKVKAIAFDLGNVLVRIHPERFLTSLGIVDRDRQLRLRDALIETVRTYERGGLATYDCLQTLGAILEYEFDRDAIRRAFSSILTCWFFSSSISVWHFLTVAKSSSTC